MNIANTIIAQLGGARFEAMTGAKQWVNTGNGVQFAIGRGAINKANKVRITLDENDTYTVSFFNIRGVNVREISTHSMVYADQLTALFTKQTGMDTRI